MIPSVQGFQVPKAEASPDSCEDAWAFHGTGAPIAPLRLALADGATTASGSGPWARLLVEASVACPFPWTRFPAFLPKLDGLRSRWQTREDGAPSPDRPWFVDAARARGAFATLLRVEVRRKGWYAEAWGDTCLFHIRAGRLVTAFPYQTPDQFHRTPFLLASRAGHDRDLRPQLRVRGGGLRSGDRLFLATDALACRMLRHGDWRELASLLSEPDPEGAFQAWVEGERREGRLKNDDSTLVEVRIP